MSTNLLPGPHSSPLAVPTASGVRPAAGVAGAVRISAASPSSPSSPSSLPRTAAGRRAADGRLRRQALLRPAGTPLPLVRRAGRVGSDGPERRIFGGHRPARLSRYAAAAVFVFVGVVLACSVAAGGSARTVELTVRPGDSLWSIAARIQSGGKTEDTSDMVERIRTLNDLPSDSLPVGLELVVPAS